MYENSEWKRGKVSRVLAGKEKNKAHILSWEVSGQSRHPEQWWRVGPYYTEFGSKTDWHHLRAFRNAEIWAPSQTFGIRICIFMRSPIDSHAQ